jgi:hypothetical protein
MFAHLYKPFYFPGEIVRGSIILDFFNDLPTTYKKVMLRLKGEEYVNKHHDKVKAALTKAQNIAKLNGKNSGGPDWFRHVPAKEQQREHECVREEQVWHEWKQQ